MRKLLLLEREDWFGITAIYRYYSNIWLSNGKHHPSMVKSLPGPPSLRAVALRAGIRGGSKPGPRDPDFYFLPSFMGRTPTFHILRALSTVVSPESGMKPNPDKPELKIGD